MSKSILYILGAGRSGTTLVDIILGNGHQFFSGGELNRLPKRNGIPPGRSESEPAYRFWKRVSSRLSHFDFDRMERLSKRFEYHAGILSLRKGEEFDDYLLYVRSTFGVLFDCVRENTIIDSSKYPLRALHLTALPEFQYCIYVKRNPVGVLRSFRKGGIEQPTKRWMEVNLYLIAVHLLCKWVTRRLRSKGVKVMEVKYDQLINSPVDFVQEMEGQFQMDLSGLKQKLSQGSPIDTNMLFDGNRLRLQQAIVIKTNSPTHPETLSERFTYVCNRFWWK